MIPTRFFNKVRRLSLSHFITENVGKAVDKKLLD